MSDRRHHSSQRHHSGGGGPSRSTRSSREQQNVLPTTTYAGSGDGQNSGGSYPEPSSEPSLRGIYSQYGRPGGTASTPSRGGSQQSSLRSQEVPFMLRRSDNSTTQSVPLVLQGSEPSRSQQESLHSVYTNASRVVPVGQQRISGRPSYSQERPGDEIQPAPVRAPSITLWQEIRDQPPIVFGENTKSGKKARELKKSPMSRFISRSVEKAKEKLGRKKK